MGTTWSSTITRQQRFDSADRRTLQSAISDALEQVNRTMSTYSPDSDLTRFNEAPAGSEIPVDLGVLQVLAISRRVHQASQGAFDPTVGPLVDLWGFGPDQASDRAPSQAARDQALALVGFDQIEVQAETLTKRRAGQRLDLSAVAKGYGVDRAALALVQRGVSNFLLEVGGEVAVRGERPGGGPWRLVVEDASQRPRTDADQPVLVRLLLSDQALATSGDYRIWRELVDGTRISHTIDPRTGAPTTSQVASASVVAPSCAVADAWATALMVLGESGLAAIEDLPEVEALLQINGDAGLRLVRSSGWAKLEAGAD